MLAMEAQRALSRGQRCGLAAASGVLLTLLYPPFSLSILAWVALTPLIVALDGAPLLTGLFLGWLTGTIESLGVTGFWMFRAARDYFQLSTFAAAAFTVGVNQVFVALYLALFGFAASLVAGQRLRFILIPTWFVATEYLRAHFLSGNPWELLGHSQGGAAIIQLCDLTGVYGLSFLLALSATAVAEIRRTRVPLAIAMTTTLLALLYGEWRLAHFPVTDGSHLQIAMVQAALPNDQRGRPEFFAEHLSRYLELTAPGADEGCGRSTRADHLAGECDRFLPGGQPGSAGEDHRTVAGHGAVGGRPSRRQTPQRGGALQCSVLVHC